MYAQARLGAIRQRATPTISLSWDLARSRGQVARNLYRRVVYDVSVAFRSGEFVLPSGLIAGLNRPLPAAATTLPGSDIYAEDVAL